MQPTQREQLEEVLAEARASGFLGPGPVAAHIEHGLGFAAAVPELTVARAADLGSGGGVPGLVLALEWPEVQWVLLDASVRRTAFLEAAVRKLAVEDRVVVARAEAEVAGHDAAYRGTFDLVVARGFGPAAATAECGAPLLRPGGHLVVSEPPDGSGGRWPDDGISQLGLARVTGEHAAYGVLRAERPTPETYPRRVGVPRKRPLF